MCRKSTHKYRQNHLLLKIVASCRAMQTSHNHGSPATLYISAFPPDLEAAMTAMATIQEGTVAEVSPWAICLPHACMAHFLQICPPVGLLKTLAKTTTQIIAQHVPNGSQRTSQMTNLFVIFLNFLINFGDCVQNAIVYPPGVIFETPNDDFDVNKHEFLSHIR